DKVCPCAVDYIYSRGNHDDPPPARFGIPVEKYNERNKQNLHRAVQGDEEWHCWPHQRGQRSVCCGWLAQHRPEQEQIEHSAPHQRPAENDTRKQYSTRAKGRDGSLLTEQRPHHAGNKRPNKSRQCTAYVAKRTERHDSAVEGEHERDQWSRDKVRAEFAGHLLYPSICQLYAAASQLRVRAAADTNREAPLRILLLAGIFRASGRRLKGFEVRAWFGWIAPIGVPKVIIDKLTAELNAVGQEPDVRKRLDTFTVEFPGLSGQAFADFARKERETLAPIIEKANIKLN